MGDELVPLPRGKVVKRLRALGWDGPYPGRKHATMRKGKHKLTIPNTHSSDISKALIGELLKQAGVSRAEWNNPPKGQRG